MDTILQLSRRLAHNSSPSANDLIKYSPTDSLKLSNRDNKRIERRKPNCTECENIFLLDQFALHREILTCKATNASTNFRKQEIWRLICSNLNQNNTLVRRTPAEVRRKWKNLVTAGKKELWEMKHRFHMNGGAGANGRKISELSQRVLQLHSSGNSSNNSNGLFGSLGALHGGSLLGNGGVGDKYLNTPSKYSEYVEDKNFIRAHFTPIITLSESNNNHINLMGANNSDGPPSPMSDDNDEESSESRNATELMSDSGIYEQEGIDLRVNVTRNGTANSVDNLSMNQDDDEEEEDEVDRLPDHILERCYSTPVNNLRHPQQLALSLNRALSNGPSLLDRDQNNISSELGSTLGGMSSSVITTVGSALNKDQVRPENNNNPQSLGQQRKCSETTEEMSPQTDPYPKLHPSFVPNAKDSEAIGNIYKTKLQLQIEILKLTKKKLIRDLKMTNKKPSSGVANKKFPWMLNKTVSRETRSKSTEK